MNNKYMHFASLVIVSLFLLLAYGSTGDNDGTSSSGSSTDSEELLAYDYAEDFVKQRLKSPSSAEFPSFWEHKDHVTSLGGRKYKISSYVDSQNGFGAMIRSQWSCTIIFEGSKVRVENLIIQ